MLTRIHKYTSPALLLILMLLIIFNLTPGCVQKIDDFDRLNSTLEYNIDDYLEKTPSDDIYQDTPCTAMICTNEESSIAGDIWSSIKRNFLKVIGADYKETHLAGSNCYFVNTNRKEYQNTITQHLENVGDGIWSECAFDGESRICAPRFFMLGQGDNPAQFNLAQHYCAGQLNMPVLWTTPQDSESPLTPPPRTLMCYLERDQLPIVVWDSEEKYIKDLSYQRMLASLDNDSAPIKGPIMVTTEALAEPYIYDQYGNKRLNISKLEQIEWQLNAIDSTCPNCLSVLALKPTFDEKGLPDLCPLEYFLKFQSRDKTAQMQNDPLKCQKYYPVGTFNSRPSNRLTASPMHDKIDLVGVAFFANNINYSNKTCRPEYATAIHRLFSDFTLQNFQKPSVWYAVAFSEGPTAYPGCSFYEKDISLAYESMVRQAASFTASGVIGVAPYTFTDSSSSAFRCDAMHTVIKTDLTTLNSIQEDQVLTDLIAQKSLTVSKVISANNDYVFFNVYENPFIHKAFLDSGYVSINISGCHFGFMDIENRLKNNSHYSWFSNCQYYYTSKGPVFEPDFVDLDFLGKGTLLKSSDEMFKLEVSSINASNISDGFAVFYGTDGVRYLVKEDGDRHIVYDMPITARSIPQPLIFSRDALGSSCSISGANKLYSRSPLSINRPLGSWTLTPPKDEDESRRIAMLSCGSCLAYSPMPSEFCAFSSQSFDDDACFRYAEMDTQFLAHNLDPLLMRSIAQVESSLGSGDDDGEDSPACAIAGSNVSACVVGDKSRTAITNSVSSRCSYSDLADNYDQAVTNANKDHACGLGVMQCIEGPGHLNTHTQSCGGTAYNPFEPTDSACCAASKFSSLYKKAKDDLHTVMDVNADVRQRLEIKDNLNWYATWLAADRYYGNGGSTDTDGNSERTILLDHMKNYDDTDPAHGSNFVEYVVNHYKERRDDSHPNWRPEYGVRIIRLYNDGIDECQSGCEHRSCSSSSGGYEGDLDEGDPDDDELVHDDG